jgi:hypothetical protein
MMANVLGGLRADVTAAAATMQLNAPHADQIQAIRHQRAAAHRHDGLGQDIAAVAISDLVRRII